MEYGRGVAVSTERADPEDLPDNRSVAKQVLFALREAVEARRDDALERLGQRQILRRSPLEEEFRELLRVERIASGTLEERVLGFGGEHGPVEESGDEPRRLLIREGGDGEHRRVELAASPARTALEELRAGSRDHEQRHVVHPVDELVDEVEEALVCPVEVLEDEHEWPPLGHGFEEQAPRSEGLPAAIVAELALSAEADQREQVRSHPRDVGIVGQHLVHGPPNLFRSFARTILFMDAGLRLDDLAQRPQGDSIAIRQAPALPPRNELVVGVDHLTQLVDEAAFADARHADECHELRGSCVRARLSASRSTESSSYHVRPAPSGRRAPRRRPAAPARARQARPQRARAFPSLPLRALHRTRSHGVRPGTLSCRRGCRSPMLHSVGALPC